MFQTLTHSKKSVLSVCDAQEICFTESQFHLMYSGSETELEKSLFLFLINIF